jgi:hypothetical protein
VSDFTVPRNVPGRHPSACESGQLTAGELGFDHPRYEVPVGERELRHTVGRSPRREGRRAALEAAAGGRRAQEAHRPPFGGQNAVDGRAEQSLEESFSGAVPLNAAGWDSPGHGGDQDPGHGAGCPPGRGTGHDARGTRRSRAIASSAGTRRLRRAGLRSGPPVTSHGFRRRTSRGRTAHTRDREDSTPPRSGP